MNETDPAPNFGFKITVKPDSKMTDEEVQRMRENIARIIEEEVRKQQEET